MIYNHKKSGEPHNSLREMRRDLEIARRCCYYYTKSNKEITDNYVYAYKNRGAYDMGDYCARYKVYFDKDNNCHFSKVK